MTNKSIAPVKKNGMLSKAALGLRGNKLQASIKNILPGLALCVFAGLVLAILAPLGSRGLALPVRLVFWIGLCFVGGCGANIADILVSRLKAKPNPWLMAFYQSVTATIAVALALFVLTVMTVGETGLDYPWTTVFYIWVISISISIVGMLSSTKSLQTSQSARPALSDRLAMRLRDADIFALCAEDHYVRVITSKGEELVLMRLLDAIKEVSPTIGLSPHRSWWVAENGVEKLKKKDGKTEIKLKSGQSTPISRNGMKTVKDAGWS